MDEHHRDTSAVLRRRSGGEGVGGYTFVSSGTEIAYEAATQRIVVIAAGTTAEFDGSSDAPGHLWVVVTPTGG